LRYWIVDFLKMRWKFGISTRRFYTTINKCFILQLCGTRTWQTKSTEPCQPASCRSCNDGSKSTQRIAQPGTEQQALEKIIKKKN
jgi:hypothetical protein